MARKKASISSFIFGLLFGIILTLGGIAGGAYWAYKNATLTKAEQLLGQQLLAGILADDSALRDKTVEELVKEFSAIPEKTVGEMLEGYGITVPEGIVTTLVGLLTDVKIKNLSAEAGAAITENLHIGTLVGALMNPVYDVSEDYPWDYDGDVPEDASAILWEMRAYTIAGENGIEKFQDDLDFGKIKRMTGADFSATPLKGISDDTKLSELGDAANNLKLADLMTAPDGYAEYNAFDADPENAGLDNPHADAYAASMNNVDGRLYRYLDQSGTVVSGMNNALRDMPLDVALPVTTADTVAGRIISALNHATNPDDLDEDGNPKPCTINTIDKAIGALTLFDVLPAPADPGTDPDSGAPLKPSVTDNVINKLRGDNPNTNKPYALDDIGTAVDALEVRDFIEPPEEVEQGSPVGNLLYYLCYEEVGEGEGSVRVPRKINGINLAINNMRIRDMYPAPAVGEQKASVFDLISDEDRDEPIDKIPTVMQETIKGATIGDLVKLKIIPTPNIIPENQYGLTLSEFFSPPQP